MKRQHGFGLIEVLVAMSLLSVATLAIVKWFGMQKNSDANVATAMKNLQDQRFLERAIWAKYDNHSNAIDACNIRTSSQISLDPDSTCVSGTGGLVWAESKTLSDDGCVISSLSAQTLTLNGCTGSVATYVANINALPNKAEFRMTVWDSNSNAITCSLANTATPATAGAGLQLALSSNCTSSVTSANNGTVRMPKYFVSFLGKGNRNDGFQRFYY